MAAAVRGHISYYLASLGGSFSLVEFVGTGGQYENSLTIRSAIPQR